jgi:predicted ATPase with chaperone activity
MQTILRLLAGTALAAALLVVIPTANAQTQTPAPNAQTKSADIPDQKLDATASALQRVTDVRRSYEEKLSTASGDDQQRIVSEANDAMSKAVTEQGISLEEFDSIIRLAQSDVGVREKILQRVKPR